MIMPFNEHVYKLCLDYRLYSAAIQLQADMGLGKAFSGMLPFVEGLHAMGYLDEETYELYRNKYSFSLAQAQENKNKSPVQLLKEQSRDNYLKTQNAHYGEVLSQWSRLKDSTKQYHLVDAALPKNKTLKNAKLLLELGAQEAEVETR